MGAEVRRRLLGADRGVPQRGIRGGPAGREPRWAPWARFVLTLDVAPRLGARWAAGTRLAFAVLAGLRHGGVEQRGRAVASGGLGVL